jgi:ribosomal protein S18 acetylase RimI-like enzyme
VSGRSNTTVRIRRAGAKDVSALLHCLAVAFEPYRPRYTEGAFRDTVLNAETAHARLRTMHVLVAVDPHSRIVGTLAWSKESSSTAHLRGMAVLPDEHGHGVAQALLDRSLTEIAREGCTHVTLGTTSSLLRAIRFYERNGFEPSGRVSDFFGMPLVERVRHLTDTGTRPTPRRTRTSR